MVAHTRPKPMRQASRRRRCGASLRNARHDGRRAPRLNAHEHYARMINSDDGWLPLLARRARANPDSLFARYEGAPLTFDALDRMSNALAVWMRSIGLVPGN